MTSRGAALPTSPLGAAPPPSSPPPSSASAAAARVDPPPPPPLPPPPSPEAAAAAASGCSPRALHPAGGSSNAIHPPAGVAAAATGSFARTTPWSARPAKPCRRARWRRSSRPEPYSPRRGGSDPAQPASAPPLPPKRGSPLPPPLPPRPPSRCPSPRPCRRAPPRAGGASCGGRTARRAAPGSPPRVARAAPGGDAAARVRAGEEEDETETEARRRRRLLQRQLHEQRVAVDGVEACHPPEEQDSPLGQLRPVRQPQQQQPRLRHRARQPRKLAHEQRERRHRLVMLARVQVLEQRGEQERAVRREGAAPRRLPAGVAPPLQGRPRPHDLKRVRLGLGLAPAPCGGAAGGARAVVADEAKAVVHRCVRARTSGCASNIERQ